MAWLWPSWEEYVEYVNPVVFDSPGVYRLAHLDSLFETEQKFCSLVSNLENEVKKLRNFGFTNEIPDELLYTEEIIEKAYSVIIDLVNFGERLLLFHMRLAKSDAADGFLNQHLIVDEWDRYSATRRIIQEIRQLIREMESLLEGYYQIKKDDSEFIVLDLEIPKEFQNDFYLARDLLSVGLDEVALLIAARGLEGVLKKIVEKRNILYEHNNGNMPASEASFHELIEIIYRLKWKKTNKRVLRKDTKDFLHYLRSVRNSEAHPKTTLYEDAIGPRETISLIVKRTNQLWKSIAKSRSHLVTNKISRDW